MDYISLEKFKNYCLDFEIDVTDEQIEYFKLYGDFLKDYNNKVNLTSIVDDEGILKKHFLDSIVVSKYLDLNNKKVVDIGSGAGFPGIPLKLINSSIKLTLIESIGKKVKFLELLKAYLKVDYVVFNQRAEFVGRNEKYRERYDIAIARAVKNLRVLSEYCLPFVKIGGYFVAMKGPKEIDKEINDALEIIKLLGGCIAKVYDYKLALEDERKLILIKKISQTSPKYPRETAQILKKI